MGTRGIFYLDDCHTTCMIFQRMLSEIPNVRVFAFQSRDSLWPAIELHKPAMIILDEHLGDHVSGSSIAMEISLKYPDTDVILVSSDVETVRTLIQSGVSAFLKPKADTACKATDLSNKCWANFLLRIETKLNEFCYKQDIKAVHVKIELISQKLDKVCEHIEKMDKADVLERVDKFIDDVKKKPLLMVIVSLVLVIIGLLGFKVGK